MKSLILYSSKYGGTEKIAKALKDKISGEVKLVNIADDSDIPVEEYENIFIGTPIYAGKARKGIRKFCQRNEDLLLTKPTGIFLSCWFNEKIDEFVQNSFSPELIEHSEIIYAGIDADPSEMSFFDKLIVKFVAKIKQPVSDIRHAKLQELADSIISGQV